MARPLAWAAAALVALLTIWATVAVAVPRATISPAPGTLGVRTDSGVTVDTAGLTSISRVEVTVNGEQRWLEYNVQDIESGVYTAPVQLVPGSTVTVAVKAGSPLGIIREFESNFIIMEPMRLAAASGGGQPLETTPVLPPQTPLDFGFDRPVTDAWVTIDGSVPVPLNVSEDGLSASLAPTFVLKQGARHELEVWAQGRDGSALPAGNQYSFDVVAPLTLSAAGEAAAVTSGSDPAASSGPVITGATIQLKSSVPFDNPSLVEQALQVSRPELCQVRVDGDRIILDISQMPAEGLSLTVPSAFGADGSYLEMPAQFSFKPAGGADTASRTIAVATGLAPLSAPPAKGSLTDASSDVPPPPPGWPPCCPWPPR